jgi:hypothetical protein
MTHALTRFCTATTLAASCWGRPLSGAACEPPRPRGRVARRAEASWKLEIDGTALVLERMDIYLVEDESRPRSSR